MAHRREGHALPVCSSWSDCSAHLASSLTLNTSQVLCFVNG